MKENYELNKTYSKKQNIFKTLKFASQFVKMKLLNF